MNVPAADVPLLRHPSPGDDPPSFRHPWEAHAFAIVVMLHQRGLVDWAEWTETLACAIADAQREGDPDLGDTYYRHWLAALETLVARKALGSAAELERFRAAWHHAAQRTPHGQPIELTTGDFKCG